ncbi:helix-turn-helix domain-containing protein [Bacteroides timonensis]|uniref:helix-turn-helix domain-containing protein n=1 Tax=Bacteroides timonensis TaxID=1470345 RepID=UPI0004B97381|nr:helix-turn-helix domain-containing protein [Bacteroides timonensis]
MDYIQLGKRLKAVREIYGFSQAELAERLGVTQTYITRIENGKGSTGDFLVNVLSLYSQYVSLDRLFDENFSIVEAMQEDLPLATSEVVRKRASMARQSVNDLFEKYKIEMDETLTKMRRQFNAKMDALE